MNPFRRLYERLKWALTPPSRKKRLLDGAIQLLEAFPGTRDLLDLAKAQGIGISFSGKLIGSESNGHVRRQTDTGETFIELAPKGTPEQLAATLIHELRHVWQNKTMGTDATTTAREEQSAEMNALITRVREADAFAFTDAMIEQINFVSSVLADAVRIAKNMTDKNDDMALSNKDLAGIGEMLMLSRRAALPDPRRTMTDVFNRMLPVFDGYDRRALRRYHAVYTHPLLDPQAHAPPAEAIDIPKLRGILKTGIAPDATAYMADLDDKAFSDLVLKDIAPKIREAHRLMDAFEAAAAKGALSANDNLRLRRRIADKVREAQDEPPLDSEQIRAKMGKQAGKTLT